MGTLQLEPFVGVILAGLLVGVIVILAWQLLDQLNFKKQLNIMLKSKETPGSQRENAQQNKRSWPD